MSPKKIPHDPDDATDRTNAQREKDALEGEPSWMKTEDTIRVERERRRELDLKTSEGLGVWERVGSIPLYILAPRSRNDRHECILYFHGGGGLMGSEITHASLLQNLADRTGLVFISVGYGLGPDHSLEDMISHCVAVAEDVLSHRDIHGSLRYIVGDSFGAFLAFEVAEHLQIQQSGSSVRGLIAVSGWFHLRELNDNYPTNDQRYQAHKLNGFLRWLSLPAPRKAAMPWKENMKVLILCGTNDPLIEQSRERFRELDSQVDKVQLEEFEGGWHGVLHHPQEESAHVSNMQEAIVAFLT